MQFIQLLQNYHFSQIFNWQHLEEHFFFFSSAEDVILVSLTQCRRKLSMKPHVFTLQIQS